MRLHSEPQKNRRDFAKGEKKVAVKRKQKRRYINQQESFWVERLEDIPEKGPWGN